MYDLAITNGRVYIDGRFRNTNVYIKNGKIAHLSPLVLGSVEVYDADRNLVLPGIIDPHTHFELDLGNISSVDNFLYGTKAAAFGGVTTIIDFIDPVSNAKELEKALKKRINLASKSVLDYKFHACLKNPKGNIKEIVDKMKDYGLHTVKIFTTYSDSNRRTYDDEIIELLKYSKKEKFLVLAHIENDEMIKTSSFMRYHELPDSRPSESETKEALKIAGFVKMTGGRLYMVHLSSGETLKALKQKYPDILNKKFFIESCPHYFVFSKDKLKEENGYLYTMAPPLRSKEEVKLLGQLIRDVYAIGTDHCTFNKKDKNQKYLADVPLGIGGIEFSFPIMFSVFGDLIIDKMTKNVALANKLYPRKGVISEGSDADIFVYKLNKTRLFDNHAKCDYTPYKGMPVNGEVIVTISNGKFIVKNGTFSNRKGTYLGGIKP